MTTTAIISMRLIGRYKNLAPLHVGGVYREDGHKVKITRTEGLRKIDDGLYSRRVWGEEVG